MDAHELMIGDYFRVTKDVCIKKGTIVEVRSIDTENNFPEEGLFGCASCHPLDENQFTGGVWLDYLEPIPLTTEILEKNFGSGINDMFYDGDDFYELMIYEVNDGTWLIQHDCIEFSGIPRQQAMVSYVHELQNAIRLFGTDKEIVI